MKLEFIKAGEIVTTHGVRGEVKVLPWVDSPEDLCEFERCRIDGVEYIMESCRVQKTCNLVKFTGIDTMDAAQAMRGKVIELYREDIDDEVIFADELLNISGIMASFVLYPDGEQVYISARSIGDANVQVILEPLGGGGNTATAGAQIPNCTVKEALDRLVASIDQFYEE